MCVCGPVCMCVNMHWGLCVCVRVCSEVCECVECVCDHPPRRSGSKALLLPCLGLNSAGLFSSRGPFQPTSSVCLPSRARREDGLPWAGTRAGVLSATRLQASRWA